MLLFALLGEDLVSERVLEEQAVLVEKALTKAKRQKERKEKGKSTVMPALMTQTLEEALTSARTKLSGVQQRVEHLHTESEKCKWYARFKLGSEV